MAIQEMELDPNAAAYTDDEIVGKVNTAVVNVTRENAIESAAVDLSGKDTDDLSEGTGNKYDTGAPPSDLEELPDGATRKAMSDTEKTKLTGIEDNAKDDQSGAEIRDAIVGLPDLERKIIVTDPQAEENKIVSLQRKSTGKLGTKYDDEPEA